jgi:tetratricopeptide (TPR) repeat protein
LTAKLALIDLYHFKGDDVEAVALMDLIWSGIDQLSPAKQIVVSRGAAVLYQTVKPKPLSDKAYTCYQYWLKRDPDNVEALNNLACLLADDYSPPRAQEGLSYAQKALDEVTRLGQKDSNILDTEGWLLILSGDPAKGIDVLNGVVQTNPYPEACLHLGEGYLRLEYASQAKQQAELGLNLLGKRDKPDPFLRSRLQELDDQSQEMVRSKQQAQVP